jgi:hypothetical protein
MMILWSLTLYERPSLGGRIAHAEEEAPLSLIMYPACFCCCNNSRTIYLQPWRQVVRFRKKRKTANMKKNTYLFAGSNWFLSGLEPALRSVGWSLASQLLIAPIHLGQHHVLNTQRESVCVFVRVDFEPSEESKFASDRPILVHLTCKHHLIITDLRNLPRFSNFRPTARRSAGAKVAQIYFSPYLPRLSTKKAFKSLSKTAQITPLLFANPPHQRCICIERRN